MMQRCANMGYIAAEAPGTAAAKALLPEADMPHHSAPLPCSAYLVLVLP